MNESQIKSLLEQVRSGQLAVDEASAQLRSMPFEDLGFARVDHHRALRCGFPEVIFCTGKTDEQVAAIAERIVASGSDLLATRATPAMYEAVTARCPSAVYHESARTIVVQEAWQDRGIGEVLVVSAGTSDIPVAEEAAVTARVLGNRVERVFDVGVAGIHRLFSHREAIMNASVLIVVAGMEGALPSVVGGMVSRPVIAVPTSVGYGASFNGLAALLAMLNSCASGVTVVNIDGGFNAGYAAGLINRKHE
ncbi:MAG: nickel pincer cofactor biosynthesis protein LarB [Gemmatimonadetes bacterium]|nr:nickel pincer cofactor biosynthesis protein LarB [Gemmatimonadota bacterium]MYH17882.1 nickel pincer cofactor biosynthesis protein LarB [Gemmatimonadota bacterium]MYK99807.1 nickel pincer cofactor biosynthesis protein LarB [Gemmatimonadota bacterium]